MSFLVSILMVLMLPIYLLNPPTEHSSIARGTPKFIALTASKTQIVLEMFWPEGCRCSHPSKGNIAFLLFARPSDRRWQKWRAYAAAADSARLSTFRIGPAIAFAAQCLRTLRSCWAAYILAGRSVLTLCMMSSIGWSICGLATVTTIATRCMHCSEHRPQKQCAL